MATRAPECLAQNCTRPTWDGYCWQHREMRKALLRTSTKTGDKRSVPAPPKMLTSNEEEAFKVLDVLAARFPGYEHPRTYDEIIIASFTYVDLAVLTLARKELPIYDQAIADSGSSRSSYYDDIRRKMVDQAHILGVSMSPEDFAEFYADTDPDKTGHRRSVYDECFIASYGMRMGWEIAQHRGEQNASAPVGRDVKWGDDYIQFVANAYPGVLLRIVDRGTKILGNWDEYVINGMNGHEPVSKEDMTVEQWDFISGTIPSRFASANMKEKTLQSLTPQLAKKVEQSKQDEPQRQTQPKRPTQQPQNIGAAVPPQPVRERFDNHEQQSAPQQPPSGGDVLGGFLGALASGISKAADKASEYREREAEQRRQAEESRRRQEAAAAQRAAEEQKKVDEWALKHGYTPDEWRRKKAAEERAREANARNQALRGEYYRSGSNKNDQITRDIKNRRLRRWLG